MHLHNIVHAILKTHCELIILNIHSVNSENVHILGVRAYASQ